MERRGHEFSTADPWRKPDIALVFGGTRRLGWLTRLRAAGVPVVHRVGPLNWRHRVENRGWRRELAARSRNRLMRLLRDRFANGVVYQSEFVRRWWHREHGPAPCVETVAPNGVDLGDFTPVEKPDLEPRRPRMVCVEASVPRNPIAIQMLRSLSERLVSDGTIEEIRVYGRVGAATRRALADQPGIRLSGMIDRDEVPSRLAECDVFVTLEMNGACPNAIVEALAAGLPVIGFDTGAAHELVGEAGRLAPFDGDPWQLDVPPMEPLINAARAALDRRAELARRARERAERHFDIRVIASAYTDFFRTAGLPEA